MKKSVTALAAAIFTGATALALVPAQSGSHSDKSTNGTATIMGDGGAVIGKAALQKMKSGQVLVTLSVGGLAPGWHAVHIHEKGECNPAEGFTTAGGHLAGGKDHGINSENGPHPGDLPNQMVYNEGRIAAEMFAVGLNLSDSGEAAVFDEDGSAIIIHEGRDDYESQPAGAAGKRVACGVIEKQAE